MRYPRAIHVLWLSNRSSRRPLDSMSGALGLYQRRTPLPDQHAVSMKNNPITRISKYITTALYRRYLGKMLEEWPAFVNRFYARDAPGDGISEAPDLVMLSSSVLRSVMTEALGEIPEWCVPWTFIP